MQSTVWRLLEPSECPAWALGRYAEVWQKGAGGAALFAAVLAHHLTYPVVFEVFREVDGHLQLQRLAVETELEREVGPALVSVATVGTLDAPTLQALAALGAEDDRARAAVVPTASADGVVIPPSSLPTGRVTAAMDTAAPIDEEVVLMEAQSTPLSLHERPTAIFGVPVVVEAKSADEEEGGEE